VTPLHTLARHGVKEVLTHLLVDKARGKNSWTPLHELAYGKHITKEDLKKRFPWYKKEIKDIEIVVDEIVNTPDSVRFILDD